MREFITNRMPLCHFADASFNEWSFTQFYNFALPTMNTFYLVAISSAASLMLCNFHSISIIPHMWFTYALHGDVSFNLANVLNVCLQNKQDLSSVLFFVVLSWNNKIAVLCLKFSLCCSQNFEDKHNAQIYI